MWIFEWDSCQGEGSIPARLPHTAYKQLAPASLDWALQLWSKPIIIKNTNISWKAFYQCERNCSEIIFYFLVQGRSFTWLNNEDVTYSNWNDGEPSLMAGCGHMTTTGQWTVTPCDSRLDAAICQMSGMCVSTTKYRTALKKNANNNLVGLTILWQHFDLHSNVLFLPDEQVIHQWIYPGMCPQSLGEWAWVPFRNHCYAFNLQLLRLQDDAHRSCKKSMEASQKPHVSISFIVQLVQLITLNWKPIKYKSPVLVHGKHDWQNTSIILNLATLSFSLGQNCSVSLVINSVWFHLCFFLFCLF